LNSAVAMIRINDLDFVKFISEESVLQQVQSLAGRISADYESKTPLFLPVLNGSFMFAADLIRNISIPSKISFVKVSSYAGTASTGQLKTLVGIDESVFNQNIIIVEDIVDTGLTLTKIVDDLKALGTKSIEVVTLLRKKPAREKNIVVKYVGFDIDDEFVLGYGLDYDGLGRSYKDIYKAANAN
jgi:hypoxanthine phosphoribosyltransferase